MSTELLGDRGAFGSIYFSHTHSTTYAYVTKLIGGVLAAAHSLGIKSKGLSALSNLSFILPRPRLCHLSISFYTVRGIRY